MKTITIINGKAKSHPAFKTIQASAEKFQSSIKITAAPGQAAAYARFAVDSETSRIIVAGGDGTVSEVVNGMSPEFPKIDIGIIPLGTGNDLSRSLDLPLNDLDAAIEAAYRWTTVPIDIIRVANRTTHYFVNAASGGFGGEVSNAVSKVDKQFWGNLSYWIAALNQIGHWTEYDALIETDDKQIREKIFGLAVNNGRTVGGGFPLVPSAKLNDEHLAVTIVPVSTPLELLAAGVDLSLGRRLDSPRIQSFWTKSLHVKTHPTMLFSLDGELARRVEARFDVLPGKLNVCAGPNALLNRPDPSNRERGH